MPIKDQENIDELRKRLYDRGARNVQVGRHDLSRETIEVSRGWGGVKKTAPADPISTRVKPTNPPVWNKTNREFGLDLRQ